MKTWSFFSTVSILFFATTGFAQTDLPKGISTDWFTQQTANISAMQYKFAAQKADQSFSFINPANRLGFNVNSSGYTVTDICNNTEASKWAVHFKINQLDGQSAVQTAKNYSVSKESPVAITYNSPLMNVEYVNTPKGMRQNFIVHKNTSGSKNLRLTIKVETSLSTAVKNNTLQCSNGDTEKDIQLIYDQLRVWDATGAILPASMRFSQQTGLLTIEVKDQAAEYPVTIDPLNRAPEWAVSADGILPGLLNNLQLQVQTTYGYTVAGLGDINGDGFDDAAVGAPTMADLVTGSGSLTGVGAVFIYLGSPAGLSATPAKVLQPTTPVNGALFGFSIAAGDISGDGKNDIVIGAPLDSYQTTAASLFGATSVNVTAGKVYVYRSEDLFTAPVPAPFLQIRLQGTAYFSTGIAGLLLSNVAVNPLFGFSVALAKDMNNDGKDDIIIGAPVYQGVNLLSVKSGAAFVYYSNNLATTTPLQLNAPSVSLLGIAGLPLANTNGLLFGFSVDGAGDYNNDGFADVVVGAPAGINLNSLGGIFTGQFLGGSAYVFYGSGAGMQNTSTVKLQASPSGLLSNAANLFGYKVKGAKNAQAALTGNILIGAPSAAVLSNIIGGLQVKAGALYVFKSKSPSTTGSFTSDQTIASPRSSSILSILSGQTINLSLLYAASIDNMLDVNCDNIGDIIVGEPLSTAVPVLGADIAGGSAYIYLGKADGTYETAPFWDLSTEISPLLGVNATALLGMSVAGAGYVKGHSQGVRSLVGVPSNPLDFGAGLLDLGNTLGTTMNFVTDNNGLGKSYGFSFTNCTLTLPVKLLSFTAERLSNSVNLTWVSEGEETLHYYELQKSSDGIRFETMAMLFTKEAQNDDYNYPDKNPLKAINYYRLKMVDKDGSITFSKIVTAQFKDDAGAGVIVAPNPVQQDINLLLTGLQKGKYRVDLHNTAGQLLTSKSIAITQFYQKETIARHRMPAGIYWINLFDNSNAKIKSIKVIMD